MANGLEFAGGVEVRILADEDQWIEYATGLIEETLAQAVAARGRASAVLAGGGTPRPVYQALKRFAGIDEVDWLAGDERLAGDGRIERNAESNSRMIEEVLLDRLEIVDVRRHLPTAGLDAEEANRDFETRVGEVLVRDAAGLFDLVLLGLGADGHTASLFPGDATAQDSGLVRTATAPAAPRRRISLTTAALNRARLVVFLVSGESKAEVVRRVVLAEVDEQLPASWISPEEGRLLWILDRGAASRLGTP